MRDDSRKGFRFANGLLDVSGLLDVQPVLLRAGVKSHCQNNGSQMLIDGMAGPRCPTNQRASGAIDYCAYPCL